MNIEIAVPGKMSQSGSSLLKLIQNNSTPTIDLLVRESIQNSLDAFDINDPNKYVEVQFNVGDFNSHRLSKYFEGIEKSLDCKYQAGSYKYLSIRDLNTVGLTGKLKYDDVQNNDYGNLIKLIYEISKPQQNEGSGGSWGLGKTMYFRVGIGLVLYYSRIKNEYGKYESRFAATLIEDENSNTSMIPTYQNKNKRGIAWWGQKILENTTCPMTDENEIKPILDVFGMSPYKLNETYIDEQKLLKSNQIEYEDDETNRYWLNNLETYLRIAVQRWYAPRLNNSQYEYGKFLRVKINDRYIKNDEMEPVFKVVQSLYIQATNNGATEFLTENNIQAYVDEVKLRSLNRGQIAGKIAYAKVTKRNLQMLNPENKPSPFMYLNLPIISKDRNKPIVCFSRKPGMIVSYDEIGPWVDTIPITDEDEYIIGVFKLNSKNEYVFPNGETISLEEYARKSEMADHISWHDYSIKNNNASIISKIQGHVRNKISKKFSDRSDLDIETVNSGLGKLFGDALLPPENFGKKPSGRGPNKVNDSKKPNGKRIEKHKKATFTVNNFAIKYGKDGMQIPIILKTKPDFTSGIIEMSIDSSTGAISVLEWEESLKINSCSMENIKIVVDNFKSKSKIILNNKHQKSANEFLDAKLFFTKKNTGYKIELNNLTDSKLEISIYIDVKIKDKDVKPEFTFKEKRGE